MPDTIYMDNNYQYHKLTVLAPYSLDSLLPLEIMDNSSAVKAAFVERYAIERLSPEWLDACGFYSLFSHIREDGSFDAYVGKASNGFAKRLRSHNETKDFWRVALLVRRDTTYGFTTTESFYLEGRMRQVLGSSPNVRVHNIAPTGDRTLPEHDKQAMESIVLSVLRIMFLRGYRNSSLGFIADRITADKIEGFEPARTTPTYPITTGDAVHSDSVLPSDPIDEGDGMDYGKGHAALSGETEVRLAALKGWRLVKARSLGWPSYCVFSDKDLIAIADADPLTLEELAEVHGVGPKKLSDYGEDVLNVLAGTP